MPIILSPRPLVQRSQFYQQLGQLLAAGITVVNALDMLSRNPPSRSYRPYIKRMLAEISQGGTLTDALKQLGTWAPQFDLAMIHAGESSGRLDVIFKMLANHYAERAAMIRQMMTDLAYPVFLFHFAVLIFTFVAWAQNAGTMSLLRQSLGILLPLYAVVFLLIYGAQARHGERWRSFLERVLQPVPILGTARHSTALSRLAAALEALINAGVGIIEAWELAAAASGSPALQRTVMGWKPELAAGRTPSEMVSSSRQFPEVFANLYHSGEVSGQLDETLNRLHDYYQDEGSRKMRFVSQWVPKILYLAILLYAAFKIISFYMGYFSEVNKAMGP
jgi:type II secretory pathway component PulF